MYYLRKTQKIKNIKISYFTTTFHDLALKVETGWAARMVQPILKTVNVWCMLKLIEDATDQQLFQKNVATDQKYILTKTNLKF